MNFIKKYTFLILLTLSQSYNLLAMDDAIIASSSGPAEFKLSDSHEEICRELLLTTFGQSSRKTQDAVAPTMKFEFSKELMPAFKFALMANFIYKSSAFTKAQSHDAFLKAITNKELFKDLSDEFIVEFASIIDKYLLEDGILASVCHTLVQKIKGAVLDLSALEISPKLIKCLVHYYYLLYNIQPVLKHLPDLRSAVRYSIQELIEHKHIDLTKNRDGYIIPIKIKTEKGTIIQYRLNLAGEQIDDIEGIQEFFKFVPAESIISIDLSNNFLSDISADLLKTCTQLKRINLARNLFNIYPEQINTLNDLIEINLLGNPCRVFGSPAVTRKTQNKNTDAQK